MKKPLTITISLNHWVLQLKMDFNIETSIRLNGVICDLRLKKSNSNHKIKAAS